MSADLHFLSSFLPLAVASSSSNAAQTAHFEHQISENLTWHHREILRNLLPRTLSFIPPGRQWPRRGRAVLVLPLHPSRALAAHRNTPKFRNLIFGRPPTSPFCPFSTFRRRFLAVKCCPNECQPSENLTWRLPHTLGFIPKPCRSGSSYLRPSRALAAHRNTPKYRNLIFRRPPTRPFTQTDDIPAPYLVSTFRDFGATNNSISRLAAW